MNTAAEREKTYVAQPVGKSEPLSKGLSTPRKKNTQDSGGHQRVLHRLRRLTGLRGLLPRERLHVLDSGPGPPAFWNH